MLVMFRAAIFTLLVLLSSCTSSLPDTSMPPSADGSPTTVYAGDQVPEDPDQDDEQVEEKEAGMQALESAEAPMTEQLMATPPKGWQRIYQFNNQLTRISEFVDPEETDEKWTTKVAIESYSHLSHMDPIEVLLADAERQQQNCKQLQHFNLFSGYENGYPTSVRLVMCGENETTHIGEVKISKAIAGEKQLYVVKVFKKVATFDPYQADVSNDEIAAWSQYLKRIYLCNLMDSDHPCVSPEASAR